MNAGNRNNRIQNNNDVGQVPKISSDEAEAADQDSGDTSGWGKSSDTTSDSNKSDTNQDSGDTSGWGKSSDTTSDSNKSDALADRERGSSKPARFINVGFNTGNSHAAASNDWGKSSDDTTRDWGKSSDDTSDSNKDEPVGKSSDDTSDSNKDETALEESDRDKKPKPAKFIRVKYGGKNSHVDFVSMGALKTANPKRKRDPVNEEEDRQADDDASEDDSDELQAQGDFHDRGASYARRKSIRKSMELDRLRLEEKEVWKENKDLQFEGERLSRLLEVANHIVQEYEDRARARKQRKVVSPLLNAVFEGKYTEQILQISLQISMLMRLEHILRDRDRFWVQAEPDPFPARIGPDRRSAAADQLAEVLSLPRQDSSPNRTVSPANSVATQDTKALLRNIIDALRNAQHDQP